MQSVHLAAIHPHPTLISDYPAIPLVSLKQGGMKLDAARPLCSAYGRCCSGLATPAISPVSSRFQHLPNSAHAGLFPISKLTGACFTSLGSMVHSIGGSVASLASLSPSMTRYSAILQPPLGLISSNVMGSFSTQNHGAKTMVPKAAQRSLQDDVSLDCTHAQARWRPGLWLDDLCLSQSLGAHNKSESKGLLGTLIILPPTARTKATRTDGGRIRKDKRWS